MPPFLVFIIVGLLFAYIGYLRLQLYIHSQTLSAFQHAAIVVQPENPRSDFKGALFAFGMLLLAGGVIVMFMK
jgi:hypothetical protein